MQSYNTNTKINKMSSTVSKKDFCFLIAQAFPLLGSLNYIHYFNYVNYLMVRSFILLKEIMDVYWMMLKICR